MILETVGNTPLIKLSKLFPDSEVYAKLESFNPTGSIKDRVAKSLVLDAESKGILEPGSTLLEPTSGNTGIALGMIASSRGYRFKAVIPKNVTPERIDYLKMYGAEIIYSPADQGSNGAVRLAQELIKDHPEWVMLDQYSNPANPDTHFNTTAPEILKELPDLTTLVAGLGTGGTLMGTARRFEAEAKEVEIIAAEPFQGESVEGLRSLEDGFAPPILDLSLLDRKILVKHYDSILWTQRLLRDEGIFAGISAGSALSVANKLAGSDRKIVVVIPDRGDRYLSSGIYQGTIPERLEKIHWW